MFGKAPTATGTNSNAILKKASERISLISDTSGITEKAVIADTLRLASDSGSAEASGTTRDTLIVKSEKQITASTLSITQNKRSSKSGYGDSYTSGESGYQVGPRG